ncbi:MAG: hypothetical protein HY748_17885 [Elusimicrobia bacterium]|nr:hypothetical protein [Elusimicrobiota bacterium]
MSEPISEEEQRQWREAAASESIRRDFETVRENVRRSTKAMTLDEVIEFLTSASAAFDHPRPQRKRFDPSTRFLI